MHWDGQISKVIELLGGEPLSHDRQLRGQGRAGDRWRVRIGHATVKRLLGVGAQVLIADVDVRGAESLAATSDNATAVRCDVSNPDTSRPRSKRPWSNSAVSTS